MSSNLNRKYIEHYNKGSIEVIDIIDDWGLGFYLGNVLKYLLRAPHKGVAKADYEKALNYLIMHRTRPCNMESCQPKTYSVEHVADAWVRERTPINSEITDIITLMSMLNNYREYGPRQNKQHYSNVIDVMIVHMRKLLILVETQNVE